MNIALLGFGTVNKGVYDILKKINNVDVSKILIRDINKKTLDCMTLDYNDILQDKSIDTVVEAMGGLHPAKEYILSALKAKKNVVTANKAVVAAYFEEFVNCAKENNVKFMVEATSGGGIPWIKNLQRASRIDSVEKIWGIMNGTSNYILSAMTNENKDFETVLKSAQELGYAEADPSADIDGDDVKNKCVISASIAFKSNISVNNIPALGIRYINKGDIEFFKSQKCVCKLFAFAQKEGNFYDAAVEPVIIPDNTVEANVDKNFNITCLFGDTIGDIKLYGQGAGGLPTGNAIVQDILDIEQNQAFDLTFSDNIVKKEIISGKYYIRFTDENINQKQYFSHLISEEITFNENHIIITQNTSPSKIHSAFDKCSDKNIFIARYL